MENLQYLIDFFSSFGYWAVFGVLLACGFGLPIPEDITLVAGGIISGLGYTNVHVMFGVSMLGVLVGDGIIFSLGYFYGERAIKGPLKNLLTPSRFETVQSYFQRYGNWVIFVGRFTPGLRAAIFLTAGLSRRVSFIRFFVTDGLAALISVPVWVYLGYYGAHEREQVAKWVREGQIGILSVLGLAVVIVFVIWYRRRKKAIHEKFEQEKLLIHQNATDTPTVISPTKPIQPNRESHTQ